MKIFKFGGASVKDADAVKNLHSILKRYDEPMVVVISAMGKTTNAMEEIVEACWEGKRHAGLTDLIYDFHKGIMADLFNDDHPFYEEFEALFADFLKAIELPVTQNYDFEYDRIVHYGEIFSTKIISHFLSDHGIENRWLDARKIIRTNDNYREGRVDWETTEKLVRNAFKNGHIGIVQGFIGHTPEGYVTTLGREGSDFTAAILAWCLEGESVTIWKDVEGVLNADPKYFDEAVKLERISYREALELSYYGASVIHPKTIKPLRNKSIPLYVRSFMEVEKEGTTIHESDEHDTLLPSFIFKHDQALISMSTLDFSFVVEEHLEEIFGIFNKHKVRINMMQNSALNFSVCSDNDPHRFKGLIEELQSKFKVLYNPDVELVTIRHYDEPTIEKVIDGKKVLVDQRSRVTARMVVKD